MTAISDIPITSYCWGLGAITVLALGVKSIIGYRKSRGQLTKYMIWFSGVFFLCLISYSLPALFTLDPDSLRVTYLIGEFFFYAGLVAQAAILWCLILRRYFSIYYVTIPVALVSLGCWIYDTPRSQLSVSNGFINYYDPRIVSVIIAIMMIGLFVPVGIYFLRAASFQVGLKATITSFMMGLMYAGIGLSTGSQELFARQIVTPIAAVINLLLIAFLFIALVAPWQLNVKLPGQAQIPVSPKPN